MVVFFNVAYIYSNFALCMNLDNFVKNKVLRIEQIPVSCVYLTFPYSGSIIK